VSVAGLLVLLLPTSVLAQSGQIVEYYHLDALGSVRVVTDQNAQVVARHDFLPFGEEWNPPANAKEKKLFTGHERDAETGLDYFGARYYRPQMGRFTSPDPIGLLGGGNFYAYVGNNPLRYIDPDGLQKIAPIEPIPTYRGGVDCDKNCQDQLWRQIQQQDSFNRYMIEKSFLNGTPGWLGREAVRTALLMRDWQRQLVARGDRSAALLEAVGSICQLKNGQLISPPFQIRPSPCGSLGCPTGTKWLVDLHTHGLEYAQPQPSPSDIGSALSRAGVLNFVWTASPWTGFPGGAVFQYNAQGAVSVWGPPVPFFPYR
jgi:RHS repeat-associated protein